MALNIGDINFGVDADTTGLRKAVGELNRFRKIVDQTARAQEKGSSQTAAALGRQESAIKRAFQQTLNLRRALKQAGAPATEIARVTKAFQRLTKEMTSGRLSTVEFARAQDAFAAKLGRSSRVLKNFKASEAAKRTSKFTEAMRDLESASVLAVGPLSGLGARIRALGAITSRSTLKIAAMLGAITALVVGVGALLRVSVTSAKAFAQIESTLTVATGSIVLAGREMRFVTKVSKELGLDLAETAKQFSHIAAAARGTELQGKGVRDIFLGVVEAGAALRLSSEDVAGALRAVQQMISKGTVSAEEMRQQFGERIPGAFKLAADALGVTTEKFNQMLASGEITSTKFLPKLAKQLRNTFSEQAVLNARSLTGSINSLKTSVFQFARAFDEAAGISDLFRNALLDVSGIIDSMTGNFDVLTRTAGALTGAFLGLVAPSIVSGLLAVAAGIRKLVKEAMIGTAVISALTGNVKNLVRVALVGLGAFAGFKLLGKDAAGANIEVQRLVQEVEALKSLYDKGRFVSLKEKEEFVADVKAAIDFAKQQLDELRQAKEQFVREQADMPKRLNRFGMETPRTAAFDAAIEEQRNNIKKLQQALQKLNDIQVGPKITIGAKLQMYLTRLKEANTILRTQIRMGKDEAEVQRAIVQARRKNIALNDADRDRIRNLVEINNQLKRIAQGATVVGTAFADAIGRGLEDAIFQAKSLKEVLNDVLKTMAKVALKQAVVKPLEQAFTIGFGKIGTSLFAAANGGVSPGGLTLVGEQGPELVDLPRGARVYPNDTLGALGGGSRTIVNVNNYTDQEAQVVRSNGPNGDEIIEVIVGEVDRRIAAGGSTYQTIQRTFGLRRPGVVRS